MSATAIAIDTNRPGVPMSRLVKVELRKMFDTRSGFWLMMSIAIVSTIATIAVILVRVPTIRGSPTARSRRRSGSRWP